MTFDSFFVQISKQQTINKMMPNYTIPTTTSTTSTGAGDSTGAGSGTIKPRNALIAASSEINNGRIRDLAKELRLAARENRGFKIESPPGVPDSMVTIFPDYQKYTEDVRKDKLGAEMTHETTRVIIQTERERFEKNGPRKITAEQQAKMDEFMTRVKEDYHASYEECERLERKLRRRRYIASSLMAAAIDGGVKYFIYSSHLYAKQADLADANPVEHLRGFQWIYADLWEKLNDRRIAFAHAIHDSMLAECELLEESFEHMTTPCNSVLPSGESTELTTSCDKNGMNIEEYDQAIEPPHILALRARVRETSIEYNAKMDAYQEMRLKVIAEEYKISTSATARIDGELAKAAVESRKSLFKACQALGDIEEEGEIPTLFFNPVMRRLSPKRKANQMEDSDESDDDEDEEDDKRYYDFEVVEIARKSID